MFRVYCTYIARGRGPRGQFRSGGNIGVVYIIYLKWSV